MNTKDKNGVLKIYIIFSVILISFLMIIAIISSHTNKPKISVIDKVNFLMVGEEYQLTAQGVDGELFWYSSNEEVAYVDSKTGRVIGINEGTATITVSLSDNPDVYDSFNINVSAYIDPIISNDNVNLYVNEQYQLSVFFNTNFTRNVTWSSEDDNVASVSNYGLVTAHNSGSTTIKAYISDDMILYCHINVNDTSVAIENISLNYAEIHIKVGNVFKLTPNITPSNATDKNFIFETSDSSVVSIDSYGNVRGLKAGQATLTIRTGNGLSTSCLVVVAEREVDQPEPQPTPEPVPQPTPEPTPQPQPEPTPEPTPSKKNDKITISFKSARYTGSEIKASAKATSGLNVSLTYYSDANCFNSSIPIEPGLYYAIGKTKGNSTYNAATTTCTKAVEITGSYSTKLTLSRKAFSVNVGSTYSLAATLTPSDAIDSTITWKSSNSNIAKVNGKGVVTGVSTGNAVITATTSRGTSASASVAVIGSEVVATYESNTLNYYIEKPSDYYIVTHIWVADSYNQMKVAITSPQNSGQTTPRNIEQPYDIIQNEVNNKGYQNKGLVAVNGSAMVSSLFNTSAPANWFGTSAIPYVLNDGQVIRDSTEEKLVVGKYNIIYGLTKDGILKSYSYPITKGVLNNPSKLRTNITNDGVRYTFGFRPVILNNGTVIPVDGDGPNIRQILCQVDKNNFIIVTNTMFNLSDDQRNQGFTLASAAEYTKNMNCVTTFNLDGGGSASYLYKGNTNQIQSYRTAYDGRGLSDMVYFVEK